MTYSRQTGGRPPHQPDEELRMVVELLAGAAVPQAEICGVLEIDPKTLRRHYRRELDRGAAKVEAALVMHLHRIASGSDGTALRAIQFALRARFGWSEFTSLTICR
ncbi:RNA polymerase subunit sigma-70 [Sinorhizobium fredii]|nr:RNA polymerase subunit sigma-70 [Sinorhizobium fredii]